ncbi:MAG: GNAT family N-acetyltransferase [Pirellulales bacterium]
MAYHLRAARLDERDRLAELIALSARALCAADYSSQQIEGALRSAFGVDTELVRDGTYFVIEYAGQLAACGGWSRRATLFGGDTGVARDSTLLDPATQAAKVRAFFVHPDHARAGLGRMLLDHCEAEARRHGFRTVELMATLTGRKLYEQCGYLPQAPVQYEIEPGLTIEFVPMRKALSTE